ncbi:hypothetical protein [Aestuariicoccus sp. MJ-SS9]|uniref:hypothetical protein n=1 Tax=Aestuariicoccus sp. MJ-SS9 TaxID=3079855 RepID=UPI00290810C0|nr:hypothetical protein [Aestuariicoccus sp. MJ-SS9]MDU8912898.1 hypothetical protein [Aestuariicoccus sp. MJ-SS9]
MRRLLLSLSVLCLLSACADGLRQLGQPVEPLGDFRLGFSEVVAPNLVKGPLSREATAEEWTAAVDAAIEERFGRFEGTRLYHLGISVEGYVLAQPGVPLVLSPKSALILRVTAWDDASQSKLNEEAQLITVLEAVSPETVIGSGLTQSKEEQMRALAANAALKVETWLRRRQAEDGWFGPAPEGEAPEAGPEPVAAEAG